MGMPPFRAFYDDDPLLNNFYSMEILLSTLGIPVYRDANGELQIRYRSGTVTRAMQGPGIFIDEFRSNMEELMMLQPETIESIEWFDHVGAANMTIYGAEPSARSPWLPSTSKVGNLPLSSILHNILTPLPRRVQTIVRRSIGIRRWKLTKKGMPVSGSMPPTSPNATSSHWKV